MAITDIKAFAHLTASDIETLGQELDSIRRTVELSRGERDAKYIRRAIARLVLDLAPVDVVRNAELWELTAQSVTPGNLDAVA